MKSLGIPTNDFEAYVAAKEAAQKAIKDSQIKFILILPPDLERYLSWASKHRNVHKAQIVRESILRVMAKDSDYNR